MKPRVLVTGANGFVGAAVVRALAAAGWRVRAASRRPAAGADEQVGIADLAGRIDWRPVLQDVDAVVHLAALTHAGGLRGARALARYRAVNVDASSALARAAGEAGIGRFVFMSSIKVNGEATERGRAFTPAGPPAPEDNYGMTKLAAERAIGDALQEAARVTVLRPPLVYGRGLKGNLLHLMQAIARGVPLPLGGLDNRRSLLAVDNLAAAVVASLGRETPGAVCYTLADVTLSTTGLVEAAASALAVRARLFAVPAALWRLLRVLPVTGPAARRLSGDLEVDPSLALAELDWRPVDLLERALGDVAEELGKAPA
ncbi:MAG: NAD-dependent epimerase/dehydratase family protein [Gammaproteobacteria bacterium]